MDFEPEIWDVSKEASELNSSLFSTSPTKGKQKKKRKLTEEDDKTSFRQLEKGLNMEEREKINEVKRLNGSSVTDLKKKNKRNKYLGFDKSDKNRNVGISESTDYLNTAEKVLNNIEESVSKNPDDSRELHKSSHLVENVHSKFNLKKQKLYNRSDKKSLFSNTCTQKDKKSFYENGPRNKKIKLFENDWEDDLTKEQAADKLTGTVSPQRLCVRLENHNEMDFKKKKRKRQKNETATGWKIEEHATNVSCVEDKDGSDTTATLTHSEHSINESVALLNKTQHKDNENSKKKRKKSSGKDINHAVSDQEFHSPSMIKKKKLIDEQSTTSENNKDDRQEKSNVVKKKKRKRKSRKNKFKTSETSAVDSSQTAGQGSIESRRRKSDSSLSPFEGEKRSNESKSSKTEFFMKDDLRNVGNCKNLHGQRKEISIMHERRDKSIDNDMNNPSIKEDKMQTCSTEHKAKNVKENCFRAEKEKGKIESATNSERVSLPFTREKISEILAKTKKHSVLKISDKLESKNVGNKKQTALSSSYLTESSTAKKKQSRVETSSVTNVKDLTNNRLKKKQGSNELHGSSHDKEKKSLLQVNRERLEAARFRFINEQLYSRTGAEAFELFKDDPEAFGVYHKGFQNQVDKWPVNPVDVIIDFVKSKAVSKVVADFGCGDAKLAQSVPNKVHSFDLVALNEHVTVCDIADVPLSNATVDIAVFCLSLMGTNFSTYLIEANRVLKNGYCIKLWESDNYRPNFCILSPLCMLVSFIVVLASRLGR